VATILVVDDEVAIREAIRRLLEAQQHTYLGAADGVEALKALAGDAVDVAIVDLMMPHMDGLELLRQMRDKHAGVKVIVISAFDEIMDLAERQKAVVATLKKPFELADLANALEQALSES
jgi:two-component system response regulator MprA